MAAGAGESSSEARLGRVARRFDVRRLPRPTVYTSLELVLLSLLAVQAARLFWALLTPVGPVGEWKAASALRPVAATSSVLEGFDPFFRLNAQTGPVVVTSLNLQLFGVREDRATGRGSAIIGLPDNSQRSFMVGEEIMPGVTLTAVGFDSVTITRNGTAEQLFLDQSGAAPGAPAPSAPSSGTAPTAPSVPVVVAPPPPPPPPSPAVHQPAAAPPPPPRRVSALIPAPGLPAVAVPMRSHS